MLLQVFGFSKHFNSMHPQMKRMLHNRQDHYAIQENKNKTKQWNKTIESCEYDSSYMDKKI